MTRRALTVWVADPCPLFRDGLKHLLPKPRFFVERIAPTLASVLEFSAPAPAIVIFGSATEPEAETLIGRMHDQGGPGTPTRFVLLEDGDDNLLSAGLISLVDAILPKNMPSEALGHFLEIVWLGQQVFLARRDARAGHRGPSGGPIQDEGASVRERQFEGEPDWPTSPVADGGATPVYPMLNGTSLGPYKTASASFYQISLSDRELEILQCLKVGAPNKVIARTLQITESTVKVHIKSLLKKMRVKNRTQAAVWASEAWLTQQPDNDPCQSWLSEAAKIPQPSSIAV